MIQQERALEMGYQSGRSAVIDQFLTSLGELRLDRADGRIKPYKPVLLLAFLVLITKGKQRSRFVYCDQSLTSAFLQIMHLLFPDWPRRPDVRYPFRHLESDGIWSLVPRPEAEARLNADRLIGQKARAILKHVASAEMSEEVFSALTCDRSLVIACVRKIIASHPGCFHYATLELVLGFMGSDSQVPDPPTTPFESMSERAVEELLQRRWESTCFGKQGIRLRSFRDDASGGRQILTPVNSIDLLGYQESHRTWWVFELKRGRPADSVVGQISRYLGWIRDARSEFEEHATGAIIAERVDSRLRYAVRANPNLSVWTYDQELNIREATEG